MGNVPHYPWYPDDYLSSPWVQTCTLIEEAVYRRLLDYQWKSPGCQLPDDINYLRRLCKNGVRTAKLRKILEANFTYLQLNGDTSVWRNERLYVEFCRALSKSDKARESVKLRKSRPIKQSNDISNDNRTIEHNTSIVVNHSTILPEVEVEPEVDSDSKIKISCPDSLRLSGLMAEMIKKHTPDFKSLKNGSSEKTIKRWAKDIDLMIRIDKRNPEEIEKIIIFTHTDSFWFKNVLSGSKLREQYDQLGMNMKQPNRQKIDKHAGINEWLKETSHAG